MYWESMTTTSKNFVIKFSIYLSRVSRWMEVVIYCTWENLHQMVWCTVKVECGWEMFLSIFILKWSSFDVKFKVLTVFNFFYKMHLWRKFYNCGKNQRKSPSSMNTSTMEVAFIINFYRLNFFPSLHSITSRERVNNNNQSIKIIFHFTAKIYIYFFCNENKCFNYSEKNFLS